MRNFILGLLLLMVISILYMYPKVDSRDLSLSQDGIVNTFVQDNDLSQ